MEWMIFIGCIAAGVIFIGIRSALGARRRHRELLQELREHYGEYPDREYSFEEFESLTHYFTAHKEEGRYYVDDITWHDLDMDNIFMLINHTQSSVGQEYLYALLRSPESSEEKLKERRRLTQFFMSHPDERVALQDIFHTIGRTRKVSVSDYLHLLSDVEPEDNRIHFALDILILLAAGLLFVTPSWGIIVLMLLIGYSIVRYFKRKNQIEPYIITFTYMSRILSGADAVCRLSVPEITEYADRLKRAASAFTGFRRFQYILTSDRGVGGDPAELLLDYLRMIFHVDLIKFNSMRRELMAHEAEADELLAVLGELESAIAIGAFCTFLPVSTQPVLTPYEEGVRMPFVLKEAYHPMLKEPVPNSITAGRGVLITGSNASGKSTFLKTAAICAILAQTIYAVPAAHYEGTFYEIYSSMALSDSLESGESYYMVEIRSLKRILDAAEGARPVLCFVDEVLRGTNTVERIAASSRILRSLCVGRVLCFAATHDIELTYILDRFYDNYHFEEAVAGGDVVFDYTLKAGSAATRNAIKLLSVMGYPELIVQEAAETAERFIKEGVWEKL